MNKTEVSRHVLQNGRPLEESKFAWDESTNTFSTTENNLVVDFKTGYDCTFTTGYDCTFKTGYGCTFKTGYGCTFNTGHDCIFTIGDDCTFKTGSGCTWKILFQSYSFPPLYFTGSWYWMGFVSPGIIKSGCIERPVAWWDENVERCAEEYEYTPEQQKEYRMYVDLLIAWATRTGWLEVLPITKKEI